MTAIIVITGLIALAKLLTGPQKSWLFEIAWFGFGYWSPKIVFAVYFFWRSRLPTWRMAIEENT